MPGAISGVCFQAVTRALEVRDLNPRDSLHWTFGDLISLMEAQKFPVPLHWEFSRKATSNEALILDDRSR